MSTQSQASLEVGAAEQSGLGTVFCPIPRMPLWSNHPKDFIDVASDGEGRWHYRDTVYRLQAGATGHGAH